MQKFTREKITKICLFASTSKHLKKEIKLRCSSHSSPLSSNY